VTLSDLAKYSMTRSVARSLRQLSFLLLVESLTAQLLVFQTCHSVLDTILHLSTEEHAIVLTDISQLLARTEPLLDEVVQFDGDANVELHVYLCLVIANLPLTSALPLGYLSSGELKPLHRTSLHHHSSLLRQLSRKSIRVPVSSAMAMYYRETELLYDTLPSCLLTYWLKCLPR